MRIIFLIKLFLTICFVSKIFKLQIKKIYKIISNVNCKVLLKLHINNNYILEESKLFIF